MRSIGQENLETVMIDFFGALRRGDFEAAAGLLDPPNLRFSWLRALRKRTRHVPIQFVLCLLGRVSFEQAEQASLRGCHRQRAQALAAHPLDRPIELEARPDRARPGAHRLLDPSVAVLCKGRATEPAEHDLFVVDDEAGV